MSSQKVSDYQVKEWKRAHVLNKSLNIDWGIFLEVQLSDLDKPDQKSVRQRVDLNRVLDLSEV